MLKSGNVVAVVWFMAFYLMADAGVSLSGTVRNGEGVAISGATVTLTSSKTAAATTAANGEFTITTTTLISSYAYKGIPAKNISSIVKRGNQLLFTVTLSAGNGVVSIYTGSGKRICIQPVGKTGPSNMEYTLPVLAPGCYLLHVTTDQSSFIRKLVITGSQIFLSRGDSRPMGTVIAKAATAGGDTLIVNKDGFTPVRQAVMAEKQTGIEIVMERTKFGPVTAKDLPIIKEMPDPLTMNNGIKVTTLDQWKIRRKEMIRILEDYEYGHMPPPPGNVKATVATALSRITVSGTLQADYRMMHLTFGPGEKCGLDLGIFIPVDTVKQHPVLIYLGYSAPAKSSLGDGSKALSRGYAVATINYTQLGADATNWHSTAFFPSYPEYDWRDFSAWAWGISRVVDYLVTDPVIDGEKIMATGVSRCGQPVLLAGAFDERIALAAPVAGGMALRFSGKEMGGGLGQGITEVVDQGTYWFGPNFEKFRNLTTRLPCDQHWLPALTAPRQFILLNSLSDEYGRAYAAVQTYLGAKPVYALLGADENLGLNFRAGGHGMQAEDWSALLDFADQRLLKKAGTRKFDVIPPADKIP